MGWKTSALLLSPADLISEDEALQMCGLAAPRLVEGVTIGAVINPGDDVVGLAHVNQGKAVFNWGTLPHLSDQGEDGDDIGLRSPLATRLQQASLAGVTGGASSPMWRSTAL